MSITWRGQPDLVPARPDPAGWARVVLRGGLLILLLLLGVAATLTMRLIERPLCRGRRPMTPWVTVVVCRGALRLLGLRVEAQGRPMDEVGAMVANHSSWLDILALNAQAPVVFVSKSEVAGWPGIGLLARATGTLFIRRDLRSDVADQAGRVARRLRNGETLLFFPEGTSTDGRRVLCFKPALFAGLLVPDLPGDLAVQPVTVSWKAPESQDLRFHAWWGGMEFGPHALAVLAARQTGGASITFHRPIAVAGRDRKSLAAQAEAAVRSAF